LLGRQFPEFAGFTGVVHHLYVHKIPQAHDIVSAQWYLDRFPCSCGCGGSLAGTLTLGHCDLDTGFDNT
jgi:hypothetical protein